MKNTLKHLMVFWELIYSVQQLNYKQKIINRTKCYNYFMTPDIQYTWFNLKD